LKTPGFRAFQVSQKFLEAFPTIFLTAFGQIHPLTVSSCLLWTDWRRHQSRKPLDVICKIPKPYDNLCPENPYHTAYKIARQLKLNPK